MRLISFPSTRNLFGRMVEITDWSVTMHPIGPRGRLSPGDDRYGYFALWSDPIRFVFGCGEYFLADDGAADDRQRPRRQPEQSATATDFRSAVIDSGLSSKVLGPGRDIGAEDATVASTGTSPRTQPRAASITASTGTAWAARHTVPEARWLRRGRGRPMCPRDGFARRPERDATSAGTGRGPVPPRYRVGRRLTSTGTAGAGRRWAGRRAGPAGAGAGVAERVRRDFTSGAPCSPHAWAGPVGVVSPGAAGPPRVR